MSDDEKTDFNLKKIDQLMQALASGKGYQVKIGVLGNDSRNTNIGAAHEFGTSKLPQRSFLRVPIADNLKKYVVKTKIGNDETLNQVIEDRDLMPWFEILAATAEKIVLDAFATGGLDKPWAAHAEGYENNTGQILIDTQQLRNSITSEVTKK